MTKTGTRLGACGLLLLTACVMASEGRGAPARRAATASVAPVRSTAPSSLSVTLPSGESLHLLGNRATAIYRDGPRPPVDPTRSTPAFAQRRLGAIRSTSFLVSEETRVRIAALVLHEIDHRAPTRLPRFDGTGPLEVTVFFSSDQTGGESKLESARRVLPDQDRTSSVVLRDLIQRLLEAHRSDDGV